MNYSLSSINSLLNEISTTDINHGFTNDAVARISYFSTTLFMCSYEIGGTTTYFEKTDGTSFVSMENGE